MATGARVPDSRNPMFPFPEVDSSLQNSRSLRTMVAAIETCFAATGKPQLYESFRVGTGICFSDELVVTSANVVGRAVEDYANIGSSFAYFTVFGNEPVRLTPVAVNFENDVAVLKVEQAVGPLEFCREISRDPPPKDTILKTITYEGEDKWMGYLGNVRAVREKTIPVMAPWPLKDELDWIEHDWTMFNSGPPPPSSVVFDWKEKKSGSVPVISGSPWFNLHGELVGLASWRYKEVPKISVGYVAPMSNISPVVSYAKTRGADDGQRLVMDTWIKTFEVAAPSICNARLEAARARRG